MYTKAVEPPMVKGFHYLIFFTITLIGLVVTFQIKNNINYNYLNVGEFYLRTTVESNFNFVKNTKNNFQSEFNLIEPMVEDVEIDSNFSEMTKSEIISYQNFIKNSIQEYESSNNSIYTYIDLQKQLKNSQYALDNNEYLYPYSENDLNIVAYVIYREAGSSWLSDRHRDLVGCVVKNRKEQNGINQDLNNPSYADIINEEGQYPYKSTNVNPDVIPDYCYESAIRVLENKVDCPNSIIWQATFKQGSKVYEQYTDDILGTTTYFCKR